MNGTVQTVEDSIIETNKGNKVCILLVFLTCVWQDAPFWKDKITSSLNVQSHWFVTSSKGPN